MMHSETWAGRAVAREIEAAAVTTSRSIALRGVEKRYKRGQGDVTILEKLDLDVPSGAYIAIMGPSGSGKSTLLNLIAGLDKPTSGSVTVASHRLDQMRESELTRFRASTIGFVFQAYNLIPVLTAVENVELPLVLTDVPARERRQRAETALRVVGLAERARHLPRQLSGGQEQRVAIARAIVNDPAILVADEPTGDLDRKSADEILDLLQALNEELKKTIVMVTHDPLAANRAHAIRTLQKGALQ
ncbi:ABC transporter ATP-binding protein [Sorangium sp. So ce119]|uniref:ABC transporter ATP-binding protein n=1 Tax=Sorangium sp. So ce119 TaxID=3133279 RepID=UPI003F5EAFA9